MIVVLFGDVAYQWLEDHFMLFNIAFHLHFELLVKDGPLVDIEYFFKRVCERVSSLFVILSVSTITSHERSFSRSSRFGRLAPTFAIVLDLVGQFLVHSHVLGLVTKSHR